MTGGGEAPRHPTAEEEALVLSMLPKVQNRLNLVLTEYTVTQVFRQIVQGTNLFVKIKAGALYVHLRIYVPLPGAGGPQLAGIKVFHHDADLSYFEPDGSY